MITATIKTAPKVGNIYTQQMIKNITHYYDHNYGKWVVIPSVTRLQQDCPTDEQLATSMQFVQWLEQQNMTYKTIQFVKKSPQKPAHLIFIGISSN